MCGIFGYYGFESVSLSDSQLKAMGTVIGYRGPDGVGIFNDTELCVGLGNQRLAILDIENGQQPFYSDDNSIVIVQNGEIFNHIELAEDLKESGFPINTHCDTEVLLRLYERDGISGLSKLNGMFAIAIFDRKLGKLFLIRDRVGEKPLYYSTFNDVLYFGSEIKSILEITNNIELEIKALDQYFSLNYVPVPLTMFKGIFNLQPGHYLEVGPNETRICRWWDLSGESKYKASSDTEWISLFNEILDDSVRIRLRSDVPFGAFLSGGVDSSTIVGLMSNHLKEPVNTYCIGFDNPLYDESTFAERAAKRFRTNHSVKKVDPNMLSLWEKVIYHSDQPHGDVSFMPTYKVAEMAAKDVKMILTGDGADELFAGYDKYKEIFSCDETINLSDKEFRSKFSKSISLFDHESKNKLFSNRIKEKVSKDDVVIDLINPFLDSVKDWDRINQVLYIDTMFLLSGNNLVKPDRMGMAVSIENRAPFLDYRMIELAFSIPGNKKLHNGETKYIYKKAVENLIGSDLAHRKKQMFTVPIGEWFKSSLKPLCEELLLSNRTRKRDLFNYEFLEKMLSDHCSNRVNNTREIRALMAFEYWCRIFLDKNS